jgi:hypothetical protein
LEWLWWLIGQIVWLIWTVLSWLLLQLFWLVIWILLPIIVVAVVGVRLAEYFFGKDTVRAWVKRHSLRYGTATWHRSRRALFALGVLPFRVLGWLIIYTLWHSVVSLWWTPRWSPWQRAWERRWREPRSSTGRRVARR